MRCRFEVVVDTTPVEMTSSANVEAVSWSSVFHVGREYETRRVGSPRRRALNAER